MAEKGSHRPDKGIMASPSLVWREGIPISRVFNDIYFSPDNGLAETRHVFLAGTDLPDAWSGQQRFVIGETGFGTGLNFLATWALWRDTAPPDARLHFVSAEAFPLRGDTIQRALQTFPALAGLARRLGARLGEPLPGMHRIHFDEERVHLTLLHGDAAQMFAALDARIDAWFLDGFSPAHNGSMWSKAVFTQMARLSAPGARLATFTVAGAVRRGLAEVGFAVERRPGFGRKRDMLVGRYSGSARTVPQDARPRRALILGAGIAGASLAAALRRRNIRTMIADPTGAPAMGASGNPAGIVMPRLTMDPTPARRLHIAAFVYAHRAISQEAWIGGAPSGVLQLATDVPEWLRFGAMARTGILPRSLLRFVGCGEAEALAGIPLGRPALFHPSGGAVHPPTLVRTLIGDTELVRARVRLRADGSLDGLPAHCDEAPDLIIAAMGPETAQLPGGEALGLRASLGKVLHFEGHDVPLDRVVTFGSYAAPGPAGSLIAGSSYTPIDITALPDRHAADPQAHARIMDMVARFLPGTGPLLKNRSGTERSAVRATTPDHIPILGALPRFDRLTPLADDLRRGRIKEGDLPSDNWRHLHVCSGLGSRGLVTAPLLAEALVSQITGDPIPLERDLMESLCPARFHVRAMRRGQVGLPH